MSSPEKKKLAVKSFDGVPFELEEAATKPSNLLSTLIDMAESSDADATVPTTIPKVSGSVLAIVIEYCKKHADPPAEDLVAWDAEFAKRFDTDTLYDLLNAASYLEVRGLQNLVSVTVAGMIRGKTEDQIRHLFKIEKDFTEEEMKAMEKEDAWVFMSPGA